MEKCIKAPPGAILRGHWVLLQKKKKEPAHTCVVVCAGIMKRSLDSKVSHIEALRYNNQTFAMPCSMHYFHLAHTYNSSTQDILVTNTQRTCADGAAALPMLLSAVVRALHAAYTTQNIHETQNSKPPISKFSHKRLHPTSYIHVVLGKCIFLATAGHSTVVFVA